MTTAQDGGKGVSRTHRPPLPPGNTPGTQVTIYTTCIIIIIIIIIIRYNPTCSHVPQTHDVSTVRTAAAIQQVPFMLHVMLFPMLNVPHFYIITSRSVCSVSDMSDFCSSLLHAFPVSCSGIYRMTLRWFQFTQLLTGIIFVFTFHLRSICTVSFLYFRIFSASILITFLSPEIAVSMNMYIPCRYRVLRCPVYC